MIITDLMSSAQRKSLGLLPMPLIKLVKNLIKSGPHRKLPAGSVVAEEMWTRVRHRQQDTLPGQLRRPSVGKHARTCWW